MHRPGADPEHMEIADFLCDFCGRAWDGTFPMVEGHQGSLICDRCLTVAWAEVGSMSAADASAAATEAIPCAMCLEDRDDPVWSSPGREANACRRCLRMAAGKLDQDPDWEWTKPELESDQRSAISDESASGS